MHKSRRVTALAAMIVLVFSLLTCFAFSAPTPLPEGYVVVNAEWEGMERLEHFPYELGGVTYELEYGVNAAASTDEANTLPLPAGAERVIILAPGIYDGLTLTSDMKLYGPYFGKSPNNKPGTDYYDPDLGDWALANGRSTDPAKEAVITGTILLSTGCNNVTIDGLAFTGLGKITDSGRTSESVLLHYNFYNLYSDQNTECVVMMDSSGKYNRYVTFDSCRFTNMQHSNTQVVRTRTTYFMLKDSYCGNYNQSFYPYATTLANSIGRDDYQAYFIGNRFEDNAYNTLNFPTRAGTTLADSEYRSRMVIRIDDNDFINCGSAAQNFVIRPQMSTCNFTMSISNNRFIRTSDWVSGTNMTAISGYNSERLSDGAFHAAYFRYLDISKNYFKGYTPIGEVYSSNGSAIMFLNIGPNYWDGGAFSNSSHGAVTYKNAKVLDDESCQYASDDFDILNSNVGAVTISDSIKEERTATLYLVKSAKPTFSFKGDEVQYKVFSDSGYSREISDKYVPAAGDTLYVEATEGDYQCRYTITLVSQSNSLKEIFKYGEAEIAGQYSEDRALFVDLADDDYGYYAFPTGSAVEVSTGATVEVYADYNTNTKTFVGEPITGLVLEDGVNTAHLKITSTDGEYEHWTIYIYGKAGSGDMDYGNSSSENDLLKLIVSGGSVTGSAAKGFVVNMNKKNVKTIQPQLIVSSKATYQFYLDAAGKYPASDNNVLKLNARSNVFYVRVTAENGAVSAPIKVTVNSDRPTVSYSDTRNIPSYARTAVNYLNNNGYGIFTGDERNNLNPRNDITRYELAKVIVMLSGVNVDMASGIKLGDVFDDYGAIQGEAPWAIPYIRAAYAAGLLEGNELNGGMVFNGKAATTREQFVTVMVRMAAGEKGVSVSKLYRSNAAAVEKAYAGANYADRKTISSWALTYVKLGTYFGYVEGDGRFFRPKDNIIRADVAMVIYNYVK